MSSIKWNLIPLLTVAPTAIVSQAAYAEIFFTEQQVQQAIFGNAKMTKSFVTLSKDQAKEIEKSTGINVRLNDIKIWDVEGGAKLIIDEVVGKHEFISYAVGINKDGSIKQVEIMNYNETYGGEVKERQWIDQFVGKNATSDFKLNSGIKNISGATLSCKHLADGVKRVLATYEILRK